MAMNSGARESERTDIECLAIGETAEGFVEALIAQGVDYLFLNPGTERRGSGSGARAGRLVCQRWLRT
jgi:hypothetical protein